MTLIRIVFALALLVPTAAHADVFAIVVTNNHSAQLGRPDLRYADDDGAKYYAVLGMLAPPEHLHLLTDFDRDTRGLFPELVPLAAAPTRRAVADAAEDVAKRARAALAAGRTVDVYFVFAGHGDVDRGAGFLELADGPLTAEALDKDILRGIPATHTHVILDSCNSFFVITARKPGGRRFATPDDVAQAFGKALPHVGVFLSTSAEQDVYEWSELQSGIFSHAVRSGLAGAADVDGDGAISYGELRAFVTIAAAKVKNPLYRPNVFARGPGGNNAAPLVDLAHADAQLVPVGPDETRLTVRDREALPWIDAHTERGARATLRIPRRVADGGSVNTAAATLPAARGPQDVLRMLFAQPFGPRAVAQIELYIPPVQAFGVASEDAERMDLLLSAVADQQRSARIMTGTSYAFLGGLVGAGYLYLRHAAIAQDPTQRPPRELDYAIGGAAALAVGFGLGKLLGSSPGERIHTDFRSRMALRRGDDGYIVADTERRLAELAARDARMRRWLGWAGWAIAGVTTGAWLVFEASHHDPRANPGVRLLAADFIGCGALMVIGSQLGRTPEERIYSLWQNDPGIRRIPRIGVAPAPGGAMLSLGASF